MLSQAHLDEASDVVPKFVLMMIKLNYLISHRKLLLVKSSSDKRYIIGFKISKKYHHNLETK